MGFGGINAHVVLESIVTERRATFSPREQSLSRSSQDHELFLCAAESPNALADQIAKLIPVATRISRAEMADLAAQLQKNAGPETMRAGLVASKPSQLAEQLNELKSWLLNSVESRLDFSKNIFLGACKTAPRIGFLFPGQGSPSHVDGGAWRRRFRIRPRTLRARRTPGSG